MPACYIWHEGPCKMIGSLASARLTTCIPVCSIKQPRLEPKLSPACASLVRDGLSRQGASPNVPAWACSSPPEACSLALLTRAECCRARLVSVLPCPVLARSGHHRCCRAAFDGWDWLHSAGLTGGRPGWRVW